MFVVYYVHCLTHLSFYDLIRLSFWYCYGLVNYANYVVLTHCNMLRIVIVHIQYLITLYLCSLNILPVRLLSSHVYNYCVFVAHLFVNFCFFSSWYITTLFVTFVDTFSIDIDIYSLACYIIVIVPSPAQRRGRLCFKNSTRMRQVTLRSFSYIKPVYFWKRTNSVSTK